MNPRILRLSLASILLVSGSARAAVHKHPRRGKQDPAKALISQGLREEQRRDYSAAIASFQKAIRTNARSAEAYSQLGNAYYLRSLKPTPGASVSSDANDAVFAYTIAIRLDPRLRTVSDPYGLYHGLAMCNGLLGRDGQAAEAMKLAMKASHGNPMPALYAASFYQRLHDNPNAAANFDISLQRAKKLRAYPALSKLIRSDPRFKELLQIPVNGRLLDAYDQMEGAVLAKADVASDLKNEPLRDAPNGGGAPQALGRKEGDSIRSKVEEGDEDLKFQRFRDAILAYREAMRQDKARGVLSASEKAVVLQRAGAGYRQLGHFPEAIKILGASIAIQPSGEAYYQAALAYAAAGDAPNALAFLNRALGAARTSQQLREMLLMARTDSEFDSLRNLPAFKKIVSPSAART